MIIAILGLAQCGTTMTAGIFERLGVPMMLGEGKREKLEDMTVFGALESTATLERLVEQRASLPAWGFKLPGAWLYAPVLRECLPDAVYLAILKDPASVAWRRFGATGTRELEKTCNWMARCIAGIAESGLPVRWLSYLDAIRTPRAFVDRVAQLAGIEATVEQTSSALEWMGACPCAS